MKTISGFAVLLVAAGGFLPAKADAQSEAIRTKRAEFRIPFSFEKEEYDRIGVREVQLFLSLDRGETWQHVKSTLPTSQKFRYKATRQGEHWFAVRTLDKNHELHPQGKLTPGLKVVVDTQDPKLTVQLIPVGDDRVKVVWQAADSDLDHASLRIEYSEDTGRGHPRTRKWYPVDFVAAASGEATWKVTGQRSVKVRVGIRDRAGNVGVAERALEPAVPTITSAAPGVQTGSLYLPPVPPADPVHETNTSFASSQQPVITSAAPAFGSALPAVEPHPTENRVGAPPEPSQVVGPFPVPPQFKDQPNSSTQTISAPFAPNRTVNLPLLGDDHQQQIPSNFVPEIEPPNSRSIDPSLPRIVNQLQFRLDYALEDLGSSGLSSVEIFITEDGGRKWWRYGEDQDKQSPVVLRVPRDGTYGFMIAAKSGVGLGDPPPSPGDAPHAVVVVDRSPPKARFDRIGMSEDGRTLTVNWKTTDGNAHDRPVRIEYSANSDGPWTPMGNWQENTGQLKWDVTTDMPSRIHVRMLVRDAADNMGQIVYPRSVLVDMSRPRARITNVKISRPRQ